MVLNYFQVSSTPPPGAPGPTPPLGAPSNDNNIHTVLGIKRKKWSVEEQIKRINWKQMPGTKQE